MTKKKVVDIKHVGYYRPNSSMGIPYHVYELILDDGTSKEVCVNHWYTSLSDELSEIEESIGRMNDVSNQVETYRNFKEIWIKNHYKEEGYKLVPK